MRPDRNLEDMERREIILSISGGVNKIYSYILDLQEFLQIQYIVAESTFERNI